MRLPLTMIGVVLLVPAVGLPCSLSQQPSQEETLSPGQTLPVLLDGGSDTVPPVKPVVSELNVTLIRNPCDGRGAACPQLDTISMTVSAADDQTPLEALRYVAFFGATAQEVAAATDPELSFKGDFSKPNRVTAYLGIAKERAGTGFRRATLCFAIATVDEAANVGERSDTVCVDTLDENASTTTMVEGAPCTLGCAGCSGVGGVPVALLALGALLVRRRAVR